MLKVSVQLRQGDSGEKAGDVLTERMCLWEHGLEGNLVQLWKFARLDFRLLQIGAVISSCMRCRDKESEARTESFLNR